MEGNFNRPYVGFGCFAAYFLWRANSIFNLSSYQYSNTNSYINSNPNYYFDTNDHSNSDDYQHS